MSETSDNFSLINKTKGKLPRLPFVQMKDAILGETYELSVVIVDEPTMEKLNREHRQKETATDILSFPLGADEGEIFINPTWTQKKAKEHERTYENYLGFLFIHGLLHLKGFDHGSRMESEEAKFRKIFSI